MESDIKAPVPVMVTATEMLGSIPLSQFPDIPAEFIYRIEQHFILGVLKQIETLPEQEIKDKFWHLLGIQFTPGYLWGNLIGIPQGIWSWVKDMAELVWDLIKLPYSLIKYTVTELPGDVKSAYDKASLAMDWFMSNKQLVFSFVKDLVAGPGNDMAAVQEAVKQQIYGMAEGMGATVLSQMSDFASKCNQEIGESMGKIAGYVLPDILLAVFSEGIGNALKGAFQSVKLFIEAGRAGAMTLKVLEMGKSAFAAIEKFLEGAKIFANKAYGEVKTMLRSILEYFKKILGIEEKALGTAKTAKTAETIVEEGRAISKLETTADDALKKDAQKHADDVVEEGPEKQSKAKILAKAIVIAEVADTINLPISGVIAELDLLKSLNPNVSFEKIGASDPYEIWMIGSRYLVKLNYTERKQKIAGSTDPPKLAFNKVEYGGTNLSAKAQEFRRTTRKAGGNVAVIEYTEKEVVEGVEKISLKVEYGESKGIYSPHAEKDAWLKLEAKGVQPGQVKQIYTELEPCFSGGRYCDNFIRRVFPQAEVSFSFPYIDGTTETCKQSVEALRLATEALLK